MTIEVRVPQLPESVADATLVAWHKQPGEAVARDENLADLETDKVVLEVPAPVAGVLRELKVAAGATVTSGTLLAVIEAGAAATAKATEAPPPTATAAKGEAAKLGPAARRIVEEKQLDPATIAGSGREGRVTKQDVVRALDGKPAGAAPAAPPPRSTPPATPAAPRTGRTEQRVAMTRLRARIAARLVEAQATQALLTTFNEVDMKALNEARARHKERFEKSHGVRLGFMSFFVKAAVEALRRFPSVNAYVDGSDIVYHDFYDIGVAVSTDRGLVVPVLRDADLMSAADIERAIGAYAQKARDGTITLEELTGGTFSITNGGVFGSLMSTPIVNSPQSAILGMHKVQERPVVVDGQVVVRPMMYLALTYDHRIIDGREAVQFLVTIKDCLEDPTRLLLQV
ncbi:MAG TPA: 2-oxoglutarate dehydrogenase complex dihydrolipoyllysine-residue succinyltransferase [Steroidobacteraceae bacterium]|nr:2-oxoglutarate dehydrogenase complex dihydrolipoyllysine-residue succinyltransferase [Steroidobacteraceae bacterium]